MDSPQARPPPLPQGQPPVPAPVAYAAPGTPVPRRDTMGGAQAAFDTVTGPNVRVKDNLIQLACVVVGAAVGGGIAQLWYPRLLGVGIIVGLFGALLLSGVVIGIVRLVTTVKRK